MDFRCIYQHGFARVAACTGRIAIADPPANAEAVLRQARRCADEGVAVAVFPELSLSGYSIEDLLLQDALLDGVERALATRGRAAPPTCCRCSSSARRCATATASTTARSSSTAAASSASSPKSYLPTYREFYERRQLAAGDDERGGRSASAAPASRSAPTCCSRPTDVPGLVAPRRDLRGHVGPDPAERRGGARRRDRPAQPLRQPDHRRPRRGPQAAVPLARPRAAWPPTSTRPPARASRRPTSPGTARR